MTTALYIRVSSDKQAREGDSVPAQLDALRKYATEHNLHVYREYIDDGISGTKYSQRDELQALLDDIRAGHYRPHRVRTRQAVPYIFFVICPVVNHCVSPVPFTWYRTKK